MNGINTSDSAMLLRRITITRCWEYLLSELLLHVSFNDFDSLVPMNNKLSKCFANSLSKIICKETLSPLSLLQINEKIDVDLDTHRVVLVFVTVCSSSEDLKAMKELLVNSSQTIAAVWILSIDGDSTEKYSACLQNWNYFITFSPKPFFYPFIKKKNLTSNILQNSNISYFFLPSICQQESNVPGEDRISIRKCQGILAYAVIDGHGGTFACNIATQKLLDIIIKNIIIIKNKKISSTLANFSKEIIIAIHNAFNECDDMILTEALRHAKSFSDNHFQNPSTSNPDDSSQEKSFSPNIKKQLRGHLPPPSSRAGCCEVVAVIVDDILFVGHVGYETL